MKGVKVMKSRQLCALCKSYCLAEQALLKSSFPSAVIHAFEMVSTYVVQSYLVFYQYIQMWFFFVKYIFVSSLYNYSNTTYCCSPRFKSCTYNELYWKRYQDPVRNVQGWHCQNECHDMLLDIKIYINF